VATKPKEQLTGEKAQILDADPRYEKESPMDQARKSTDPHARLISWVLGRTTQWKSHRQANYDVNWDRYERAWRAIYATSDKKRQSERSSLITPALSEAVENSVSEVEEAVFGRGSFFDFSGEHNDDERLKKIIAKNKAQIVEDLAKTGYNLALSEALVNSAVFGTGIGEIVMEEVVTRDITIQQDPVTGNFIPVPVEKKTAHAVLKSVNPRNFLIDPLARGIDDGLGCAIEEDVGAHIIRAGQESGDFYSTPLKSAPGDPNMSVDPQVITQYTNDSIPIIRYYGLVPKHLLAQREKPDELFPGDPNADAASHEAMESDDPADTEMVEAVVFIAHNSVCLKAEETEDMMKDRPLVAFQWDVVPGRFWGRGICEKGIGPQELLDAELRYRIDALAFSSAPMMGIDALKLPRGFKLNVYPGRSVLTNGDPSQVLKPFTFGSIEQGTWQQAEALDKMVQRATGAVDGISMAQSGVGGDARSGAVSMALSGIVKRSKRTLMHFLDQFVSPSLRKIMWRYMQYVPERYAPINFTFNVTSTMGIMQREYEMANLMQLLNSMQPQSPEFKMLLAGVVSNTSLMNREQIIAMLKQSAQTDMQLQGMQPIGPDGKPLQPQGAEPPMDPMDAQLEQAAKALELAKTRAEIARLNAQTMLIEAQTLTERFRPRLEAEKIATKGIYAQQDQSNKNFQNRLKMADTMVKAQDVASNERIADKQTQASVTTAAINASAKRAAAPGMLA